MHDKARQASSCSINNTLRVHRPRGTIRAANVAHELELRKIVTRDLEGREQRMKVMGNLDTHRKLNAMLYFTMFYSYNLHEKILTITRRK